MFKKEFPQKIGHSVSHTTRAPREGEIDGIHYHFTTKELFLKGKEKGDFIETATVHSNYYGTTYNAVDSVIKQGKLCILDIDVQGCENVRKSKLDAVFIFLAPPSLQELENRIRNRGKENEEAIVARMKHAQLELSYQSKKDLWDHIIVNNDLDQTYSQIKTIINEHTGNFLSENH